MHESYLRLARSTRLRPETRREFFAFAARVMREYIVDTLRRPRAADALTLDTAIELDLPRIAISLERSAAWPQDHDAFQRSGFQVDRMMVLGRAQLAPPAPN